MALVNKIHLKIFSVFVVTLDTWGQQRTSFAPLQVCSMHKKREPSKVRKQCWWSTSVHTLIFIGIVKRVYGSSCFLGALVYIRLRNLWLRLKSGSGVMPSNWYKALNLTHGLSLNNHNDLSKKKKIALCSCPHKVFA